MKNRQGETKRSKSNCNKRYSVASLIKPVICTLLLIFSPVIISFFQTGDQCPGSLHAQNVGINATGNAPDISAMLDVASTDKGILIPRMTTVQRNAITSPALSLIIFNTTTNCLEMYVNSNWISIACGCTGPPATPGAISGSTSICANSTNTYTIASVNGATSYTWTVPSGWVINSGQGTISISSTASSVSGNVCVTASNACGTSSASCISVTVTSAPSAPTALAATNVQSTSFSANWTVSVGATTYYLDVATDIAFTSFVPGYNNLNVGNVTTYSVTGLSSGTTYYYRVRAANACGTSASSNTITVTTSNCYTPGSQTFTYTGSMQSFTVPCGVTSVTLTVKGAQGANANDRLTTNTDGGLGGLATGNLAVTSGQTLYIYVGGQGSTSGAGGWNGGGTGGTSSAGSSCFGGPAGGGGGASDVRVGGTAWSNIVISGGGGGGAGRDYCNGWCQPCGCGGGNGGAGGLTGINGDAAYNCGYGYGGSGINGGYGGTQTAGGAGGPGDGGGPAGTAGTQLTGGTGANGTYDVAGGGGGGGYYGGGGGGGASSGSGVGGGGGGGGSSYIGGVTGASTTPAVNTGNGQVTIAW